MSGTATQFSNLSTSPSEWKTMDYGGGEPSRLFRDLLELEKDFRYNLTLLKIREEEIER